MNVLEQEQRKKFNDCIARWVKRGELLQGPVLPTLDTPSPNNQQQNTLTRYGRK